MVSIEELREYARIKAKQVTNKPVQVNIVNKIPNPHINPHTGRPDTVMRSYVNKFYPNDKTKSPSTVSHEIAIRRDYYERYKNNPQEIKSGISHEVAHIVVPKGHNAKFQQVARKLGSDETHTRANWDKKSGDARKTFSKSRKSYNFGAFGLRKVKSNIWRI